MTTRTRPGIKGRGSTGYLPGRFAVTTRADSRADLAASRVVCGSGWYHDEAIKDERLRRS